MDKPKVLEFLKKMEGGIFYITKDDTEEDIEMIDYCFKNGFIKQTVGGSYQLDDKGYDLIEGKITLNRLVQSPINIKIGHEIHGNVSHSDFSTNALNRSIAPPTNTHPKQSKTSTIISFIITNIWKFLLGFVIGYAVWYFTIKK
jgi:hypothetical protein